MIWRYPEDDSPAVITAAYNIESTHRIGEPLQLPETAVVFFVGNGVEYLRDHYSCELITEKFPRFLRACPIYRLGNLCFLHGGSGAPQAADTLETLAALGVRRVFGVGMCGAFSAKLELGDIIVPDKAYVEEGTSLHYYPEIDYAVPDSALFRQLAAIPGAKALPVVSTDAVYRQTFYKEKLWREKGAVGVDMETSAILSVAKVLGLQAAAVLMVSDVHPTEPSAPRWEWSMTAEMRRRLFETALAAIRPGKTD